MAKMVGDLIWHRECRDCCGEKTTTKNLKRLEREQWEREVIDEMTHPPGLCFDPKSGMAGCVECYGGPGDDYDHYDNAELDNVPGVWCNTDWRDA
jgi:hypothetical protein